jgi:hypothetical protein
MSLGIWFVSESAGSCVVRTDAAPFPTAPGVRRNRTEPETRERDVPGSPDAYRGHVRPWDSILSDAIGRGARGRLLKTVSDRPPTAFDRRPRGAPGDGSGPKDIALWWATCNRTAVPPW